MVTTQKVYEPKHFGCNRAILEREKMSITKVTIMDFYANWCQPCKRIPALLTNVIRERKNVVIEMVDVDQYPDIASAYDVTGLPTVVLTTKQATVMVSGWQLTKQHLLSKIDELQTQRN